jgi:O-glycosyl hydrolase
MKMKKLFKSLAFMLLVVSSLLPSSCTDQIQNTTASSSQTTARAVVTTPNVVNQFITNGDKSALFAEQSSKPTFATGSNSYPTITVNNGTTYQGIDGFGFTFTEGSAEVINGMSASAQSSLLTELFSPTNGIGISVVRISIGASDLSSSDYSYETGGSGGVPIGSTITLKGFNNNYVTSNNGTTPMTCDRPTAQGWEQFKVVDAGGGLIALQGSNGQYVSSENGAVTGMNCNRATVGGWETFTWVSIGTNQVQLRGSNNQYVCQYANADGTGPVACNRATASGWETFTWASTSGGTGGFSLAGPDLNNLIPLLKKVIAINPNIKFLATPWSAPISMKSNGAWVGGSLNTGSYGAYATYFVNYLNAMKTQGINIWAITPQNEPENPYNNPSMTMNQTEETNFINNNLGPAIRNAGYSTKIIAFDHNCDNTTYPTYVSNNSSYVDGAAFHLYSGNISALTTVHNATGKNVYFTEQYTATSGSFSGDLAWHTENVMIGSVNNWGRTALEWNLATNTSYGPYTSGGCTTCLGALTINGSSVTRNVSYYIVAHMSKYVRPDAVRVNTSSTNGNLINTAFVNSSGNGTSKVLVVYNKNSTAQTFNIQYAGKIVTVSLNAGSVGTYLWY